MNLTKSTAKILSHGRRISVLTDENSQLVKIHQPHLVINWLRMEQRIREKLRLVNQQCVSEERLRDALTSIDEILAHETRRGNEFPPGGLSRDIEGIRPAKSIMVNGGCSTKNT